MILFGDIVCLRYYFQYECGSCLGENFKFEKVEMGSISLFSGEVKIVYYFIFFVKG